MRRREFVFAAATCLSFLYPSRIFGAGKDDAKGTKPVEPKGKKNENTGADIQSVGNQGEQVRKGGVR